MRTEQLEYLTAVVRTGSVRRAAAELHLSQPAVSEALRNLEREVGLTLLERKRTGMVLSEPGRDLLPYVTEVLESVDRLRLAANQRRSSTRIVRIGTVNAATAPVLAPAIQTFRFRHPETQISVVPAQQHEINRGLFEGSLDLGLVNLLSGDEVPAGLEAIRLLRGRVVVCLPTGHPLTARASLTIEDLRAEPLIVMRAGYVMHRFVHRLLGGELPDLPFTMDGAEMGKLMVAEGLGVTLLPDFSVLGDPLERYGAITVRPLEAADTEVSLHLQRKRTVHQVGSVTELSEILAACAREALLS